MKQIRDFLRSILLLAATLVVSLLAAELGLRAFRGVPLSSTDNLILRRIDIIRNNTGWMVHDPLVGWRLRDDIEFGSFTTGALGIRMSTNRIEPLRTGGLLATGDSMTAGPGVSDEEAWPARLEALLGQPVLNGAAGAYAVDQMVLRAEQLLPVVKPHTLMVGISAQDNLRNNYSVYGGGPKPYFEIENGDAVLKGVPVPPLDTTSQLKLGWFRSLLGRSYLVDEAVGLLGLQERWIHHGIRYREVHPTEMGVRISCLLMERLAARKRETGIRTLVVMIYGAPEIEMKPAPSYALPLLDCVPRAGLELVDTYPAFRAIFDSGDTKAYADLWINEGGRLGHYSPAGHQLVAKLVGEKLRAVREGNTGEK